MMARYEEIMKPIYDEMGWTCPQTASLSSWGRSVVFKHDEAVEDIPLEYPGLVEDVADWWYEKEVEERRQGREGLRIQRLLQNDQEDAHEVWLKQAVTHDRVDDYLKNSQADGDETLQPENPPPPPIFESRPKRKYSAG